MGDALNISEYQGQTLFRVYCLGAFKVIQPGADMPMNIVSHHKAWSLFKFLVMHKGAPVPTQYILDIFWPERKNPSDTAALRTALSRLKAMLLWPKKGPRQTDLVIFRKDTCRLNVNCDIWIDIAEFEKQCALAYQIGQKDRRAGANVYLAALELYQGDFLAEDLYLEWAGLAREHYRRLFLDSIKEAASWLMELNEYRSAYMLLEKGLAQDPYVEELHYLILQVYVKQGEMKAALKHYAYCTNLLYKELGVKPSEGLKRIYQIIREKNISAIDILTLKDELAQQAQFSGPMFCEPDQFWNFLLYERRRMLRSRGETCLVVLQVKNTPNHSGGLPSKVKEHLEQAIRQSIRSSDLICYLSNDQLALLLPGTGLAESEALLEQLKEMFHQFIPDSQTTLRPKIKVIPQINPEEAPKTF